MMKKIYVKLLFIFSILLVIGCFHYQDAMVWIHSKYQVKTKEKNVQVQMSDQVVSIPLEEYLIGVIAGEMPVSFEKEALKAQAVASRTFVLSRNLKVDNTTNSQVYLDDDEMKKKWGKQYAQNKQKIEEAIQETQRRRSIQEEYNRVHNIVPMTIKKEIRDVISNEVEVTDDKKKTKMSKKEKNDLINRLSSEMKRAAKELDFERAMELRDAIFELESE